MKKVRTLVCLAVLSTLQVAPAIAATPEPLRDAVRKAVVSNPEVQARWHAFQGATADQDAARGGYYPQVDLNAAIGRERIDRPTTGTNDYTHRGATLSLTQMVYDGFFTQSEVARMGYAKLARYYELIETSESAALEVVRAYGDVLRYRELVRLAKANYVEHKLISDQIAQRAGAGVGRRVDQEQASGRLALAESNLLTEVSNLHDVTARYQRLVGDTPPEALPDLGETLTAMPLPANPRDALREAFNTSPAINAAVENVRAGQALVESRRSAYHPRVELQAYKSIDRNLDGVDGRSSDSVVQLVFNYNLFRGGADQARLRSAAESLNQSKDLREKACRDLRQTLAIAYNDTQRLTEQLRYLDQHQLSIEKAREAYRRQFDIGQRTLLDLLDTENEYFQARRAYANARYDQVIAQARTLNGLGKLMSALEVAREDLPAAKDIGQDRAGIDPETMCPPEAPSPLQVDKAQLLSDAMRDAGRR
ncbi:TolC family outer membrane protein [Azoarcus olearius]|uniref:Outer membrane efflux protein n=1 Tax=Azoarcus sp. (strain BH72) TaxID=418699 RepID=A1K366_AZOSB|nr:TolC family outer membrane protein [Azoarcus olearius]CAL93271.1 putative outer membrane efflux protein [Azoarcus olearius]